MIQFFVAVVHVFTVLHSIQRLIEEVGQKVIQFLL